VKKRAALWTLVAILAWVAISAVSCAAMESAIGMPRHVWPVSRITYYSYGPGAIGACGEHLVGNYAAVPATWKAFPCGSRALLCHDHRCVHIVIKDHEAGTGHRVDIAPRAFAKLAPLSVGVLSGSMRRLR
jgi:hypothetical protein